MPAACPPRRMAQQTAQRRPGFGELSQRALLEAYAPASVLINDKHEGLYYFGSADRYLKVASGEDTRDVLAMAREGLRAKLQIGDPARQRGPCARHPHGGAT